MKPADRARLADVRAGATAGQWVLDDATGRYIVSGRVPAGEGHVEVPVAALGADRQDERNAAWICAAVNSAPGLAEELTRVQAALGDAEHERDVLRSALAEYADGHIGSGLARATLAAERETGVPA